MFLSRTTKLQSSLSLHICEISVLTTPSRVHPSFQGGSHKNVVRIYNCFDPRYMALPCVFFGWITLVIFYKV
jgi:hypothetical protein